MISRLRSTRRTFVPKSLLNRPLLILAVGTGLFVLALLAGIATDVFLSNVPASDMRLLAITILAGTPLFLTGFYFTMGLLWELNASAEVESTDCVNWLPISPGEYVLASSLSTSYTYSPVLMISYGYSLPVAAFAGYLPVFLLLLPVAFTASLIGSVGVEILRSGLARASTAFNRVGGRIIILLRILGIMLILVVTQLLFSGFFVARIIGSLVADASSAYFVPIFWPTLALTKATESDIIGSAAFLALTGLFLIVLARAALYLKQRYWVIPPASVHLSGKGAITGPGRLAALGMGQLSLALLRREIRSATRRREIVRLVVIPIIIPVMIAFPLIFSPISAPPTTGTGQIVPLFLAGPFLFGVGLGALILSMTSIGQEGRTIWTLGSLPLKAETVIRIKILFVTIVSLIGLVLGVLVSTFLFEVSITSLVTFLGLGLCVIIAEAGIGIAIGSRYADFSEGPRPRFVSISGSIIGSILGLVGMALMLSPVAVALIIRVVYGITYLLPISLSISAALGVLLAWIGIKLSKGPVEKILRELPA